MSSGRLRFDRWATAARTRWTSHCRSFCGKSSFDPPNDHRWSTTPSTRSGMSWFETSRTVRSRAQTELTVTARLPSGSNTKRTGGSKMLPRCSRITICKRSTLRARRGISSKQRNSLRRHAASSPWRGNAPSVSTPQQAEARLARALELTPERDPERPRLLTRWADAAFQAGRNREAVQALDAALPELRANGDDEGTARALLLLALCAWTLGEPRHLDLAAEAVSLLEALEPGPALVDALSTLSSSQRSVGARSEAAATADDALTLAARLGLPEPANALADRGIARAELGEQEGIVELERALALLVEQGSGRGAAIAMNNLAYLRYPLEGHAASLAALEEGLVFARSRGLAEAAMVFEGNMLEAMAARGRSAEALELAATLASAAEEGGDIYSLAAVRSVAVSVLAERGEFERAPEHADWLVETVRASGMIQP